MVEISRILGNVEDPEYSESIERLARADRIEYLNLSAGDVARHRLRGATDRGTECLVSLPRNVHLQNGSILRLSDDSAIVVQLQTRTWIRLRPIGARGGLLVGHLAGHLHWGVKFNHDEIWVGQEESYANYVTRLQHLIDQELVVVLGATSQEAEPFAR